MRTWMLAVVSLAVSGLAVAVEPEAKSQGKTAATKSPTPKSAFAKPKYHYVRATPLVALPIAAAPESVQTAALDAGEVHTGRMVCEMGNAVTVTPDPQQPARFIVQMKKNTYHMTPVETTTGAVRLEDAQAGAMWLQLANKSMLMNSKLGQRMADDCQSDQQAAVAQRMKLDPPPSLLDQPTLANK